MTKAQLYRVVDEDRSALGIDPRRAYNNAEHICRELGYHVDYLPFRTRGLRAVAHIRDKTIIINKQLSKERRNFHAAHELFHHLHHAGLNISYFRCYGQALVSDPYYEWEANEGAAELLVPYRVFIPMIADCKISNFMELSLARENMAWSFGVPQATIRVRLESLKYELKQYMDGTPLDDIELLSKEALAGRGIRIKSLNELYPEPDYVKSAIEIWA